jgi:hypothetical protein
VLRRTGVVILWAAFLLSALLAGLWIKSYLGSDTIAWDYGGSSDPAIRRTQWAVQSRRGRLVVGRFDYLPKRDEWARTWKLGPLGGDVTGTVRYKVGDLPLDWIGSRGQWWEELGFAYRHTISGAFPTIAFPKPDDLWIVTAPHWPFVLLLGVGPLIAYRRLARHRRRKRKGLCLNCGYDLQGITSARCPECGTAVDRLTPSPLVGEGGGEGGKVQT